MDENNVQQNPALTPEIVKSKLQLALTKAETGIQALNNAERTLVFNEDEDSLKKIAEFLTSIRKTISNLENAHSELKAPALKQCQMIDEGRRIIKSEIDLVYNRVYPKYDKIVKEVERRKAEDAARLQRETDIKDGINKNVLVFTDKIVQCKTSEEILAVENLINLEKTRKTKYDEFLPDAVEAFNKLGSLVASQKIKVRELEALQAKQKTVKSEEEKMELQEQIEDKKEAINEGLVNIQEHALDQATSATTTQIAHQVHPTIKPRRTTWEVEVTDIKLLAKKMPHLVKLVVDEEKLADLLKSKKSEGALKDGEELNLNGIRFYQKKIY
jgi:hypothetical protein